MITLIASVIWFLIFAFLVLVVACALFVILVQLGYLFIVLDEKVQKCFSDWGRKLAKFRK